MPLDYWNDDYLDERKFGWVVIVLCVVLLLFLTSVAIYFIVSGRKKKKDESEEFFTSDALHVPLYTGGSWSDREKDKTYRTHNFI